MGEGRTRALLLVGHGSHYNADSSDPARRQARVILERRLFDEVRLAFWKEEPALCHGLGVTCADEVFVVPFFISSGYFTEQVVPREMELERGLNRRDGRKIYYTDPVGTHPGMAQVLLHRAETALEGSGVPESDVSLFIVGHGTTENENSAAAIHAQVEAIRRLKRFAEVEPAFMEQEPTHKTILERAGRKNVVIVPFFISDGLHSREDIPCDIGFVKRGQQWENPVEFRGKRLWYTRAVGSDPRMVDVILERVKEADSSYKPGAASRQLVHPAHAAFAQEVASRKSVVFGELNIAANGSDRFTICHVLDAKKSSAELKACDSPFDAWEIGRLTSDGKFRPLRSTATLRQGWIMRDCSAQAMAEAVEEFYPAAIAHWHLWKQGKLRVRPYREASARQSGLYEATKKLTDAQIAETVQWCCNDRKCSKRILWAVEGREPVEESKMVCPEPCSLFMSDARRILKLKPAPAAS